MNISDFLDHFSRVRKTGVNKWQAACPAHDDKSPSLSITLNDSGNILIHCHSACPTDSVLSAVDLKLSDLFADSRQPSKKGYNRVELEQTLEHETMILLLALHHRFKFKKIPYDDYVREREAVKRICDIGRTLYV